MISKLAFSTFETEEIVIVSQSTSVSFANTLTNCEPSSCISKSSAFHTGPSLILFLNVIEKSFSTDSPAKSTAAILNSFKISAFTHGFVTVKIFPSKEKFFASKPSGRINDKISSLSTS